MESLVDFIVLITLGFIIFCIYFIFKILQFVIQAINLYKKLENVFAVMIQNDIDNYSTDNEIFNKFDSALNEQIVKIFKLRGVDI